MDTTKYKRLEYFTNYKNPITYLQLRNVGMNGKTKVEIKYVPLIKGSISGWMTSLFGYVSSSAERSYILRGTEFDNSTFLIETNSTILNIGSYYDIICDGLNASLTINGKETKITKPSIYKTLTNDYIQIINGFITGTQSRNVYKWYGCKIWLDGTNLSYDFVPCKRLEDNVVGVYDIVNDIFHKPTKGSLEEPFIFEDNVVGVQIPEGEVQRIEDSKGHLLWTKPGT